MVSKLFEQNRSPLASFDFVDIASGTGYVSYDGVLAKLTGGDTYILIDSSLRAMGGIWGNNIGGENSATNITVKDGNIALDIDFDLSPFQLPRNIKGTALVKISCVGDLEGDTDTLIITAKLRKWDGSSETEIATATTATHTLDESTTWVLPLEITSVVHFKRGEQLRLTIGITAVDPIDQYGLCHDPTDQATTNLTETEQAVAGNSRLILAIPYRLDL